MSHLVQDKDRVSPVVYSSWYDTLVVLRVATARARREQTELHCTIKGESDTAVHIRIGQQDQNIFKNMILAVEEIAEYHRRQ